MPMFFFQSQAHLTLQVPGSIASPCELQPPWGEVGEKHQLRDGAWKQFYFCRKIRAHGEAGSDKPGGELGVLSESFC